MKKLKILPRKRTTLEEVIEYITNPVLMGKKAIALTPDNLDKWPSAYFPNPLKIPYSYMGFEVSHIAKIGYFSMLKTEYAYLFLTAHSQQILTIPDCILPKKIQSLFFDAIFPCSNSYQFGKTHAFAQSEQSIYRFIFEEGKILAEEISILPAQIKQTLIQADYIYFLLENGAFWWLQPLKKVIKPYHGCLGDKYTKASTIYSNEYLRTIFINDKKELVFMLNGPEAKSNTTILKDHAYPDDTVVIPLPGHDDNPGTDCDLIYSQTANILLYLSNLYPKGIQVELQIEGNVVPLSNFTVHETTAESQIIFFSDKEPLIPRTVERSEFKSDICILHLSLCPETLEEIKRRYHTCLHTSCELEVMLPKRLPGLEK